MTIDELMQQAHATAVEKGWWETDRNFGEQIALMHSELSEVLEEWRVHGLRDEAMLYTEHATWCDSESPPVDSFEFVHGDKPEGIAAEFADVLIRIADTCQKYGIPLSAALKAKLAYNKSRPYRHGNKLA